MAVPALVHFSLNTGTPTQAGMGIPIANRAFAENAALINASKMAILLASLTAGAAGFGWLRFFGRPDAPHGNPIAMGSASRQ